MRGAIALGLRLTGAGAGPARLRTALVVLATCIGSMLMLAVVAIARAEQTAHLATYADSTEMRRLLLAVVLAIALPILVLVATAGRLSAALRDRRLANLRLLGLSPAQTRLVAVSEAATSAMVGVLAGAVLFQLVRPVLAVVHVAGRHWSYASLSPSPRWYVAVLAGVLVAVVAVAVLPQRTRMSSALARARRADDRRPSWLRALPLLVGAGICGYELVRGNMGDRGVVLVLFVGVPLLGIGLVLVVPVLVRLLADVLLRLAPGPTRTVAARRLQAQPAGVARVVAGLLIGLFLVTGARGVVGAFESTPQYIAAARQVEVQQRVELLATSAHVNSVARRAERIRGVRRTIRLPVLSTPCGRLGCESAIVASCAQLHVVAPALTGCRDGEPMWLDKELDGMPTGSRTLTWYAQDNESPMRSAGAVATTGLPVRQVRGDAWTELDSLQASVLLPPSVLAGSALPSRAQVEVLVLAGPGRTLLTRLDRAGLPLYSAPDVGDYDFVAGLRALVWAVAAVILSVGLLAFAIAAVDRAVTRRREVVSLQLVGVPAALLRRTQWVEAALPIGVGAVLAIGFGLLAGAAYLSYGGALAQVPWQTGATLAGLSLAGAAVIAGLTVLAASPRIRPDLIRAE